MKSAVDNDVVLKLGCYRLLEEVSNVLGWKHEAGVLGAARYVLPKALSRLTLNGPKDEIAARIESFLAQAEILEPTPDEVALAANLEALAQELSLPLDVGESQLAAISVHRTVESLVTGDKRAISALAALVQREPILRHLVGRIACLEQAILSLISRSSVDDLRHAICAEPNVDKALTNCFSCHAADAAASTDGLESYIAYLRKQTQDLLSSLPRTNTA